MEDKCCQGEAGKVKYEGRAASLFENHEQSDEQVNQPNDIYVDAARGPVVHGAQTVQVRVVITGFGRIRGPFDQVMNLTTDACRVQVELDFVRARHLFAARAARSIFAFL